MSSPSRAPIRLTGVKLEPVPNVPEVRQPRCFERFRCIGADCEDTCCAGWGISVDRETYEKYRNSPGLRIAEKNLSSLVEIGPAQTSPRDYARFRLEDATCPALHKGLCSIHETLGEGWIPDLCSTYPRAMTLIGGAVQKALHLSCPEAARLVLGDPDAMLFGQPAREGEALPGRPGALTVTAGDPDDCLFRIQTLTIEWIRERTLPLWQRIVSLGLAVDRIAGLPIARAGFVMEDDLRSLRQGAFHDELAAVALRPDPVFQLETVLDLVVARIGGDYTPPRFLGCYADFMRGLSWSADSTLEELAERYTQASRNYFAPFLRRHEHILENYLASYIFRTIFPYRSKLPEQKFVIDAGVESMRNSFAILSIHYAIMRTLLIGMAALYKEKMSIDHAVRLAQSYSKAFLHGGSFETDAVEYLRKNTGDPAHNLAALVMD